MSSFSELVLQEKLTRLTSSQESIETLSLWIIHHKSNVQVIAQKWFENFHQAHPDKKVVLFYLINDVLQNSRRKNITIFAEVFQSRLKDAVLNVSGLKIQTSIERIIHIWRERLVFDETYLNELDQLLENGKPPSVSEDKVDFKVSLLEDALVEMGKFEGEMKIKETALSQLSIDVSSTDSLSLLKDKASGDQFKSDFHNSSLKLEEYLECTGIEVTERKSILNVLSDCKLYHKQQKTELEGLLKDYKQLRNHLASLDVKLKDRIQELDKAQHTATSDPTSKTDITLAGDMEIDSDSETTEEVPPQPPPPPPPPPPPVFIATPIVPPLPSFPPFIRQPIDPVVPYSPSMPKPYTPVTPLPHFPNFPPPPPPPPSNSSVDVTPPASLDDRLKEMSTKSSLPDSFFHDYSDSSDSEGNNDDKPYSPSNPIQTNPPPTSTVSFYGSNGAVVNTDTAEEPPNEGVVTNEIKSEDISRKLLNPKDIKITPSLTNILGEIFPRLSKTLEERKRRGISLPLPSDNKYTKTESLHNDDPPNNVHPDHTPKQYPNNDAVSYPPSHLPHPPPFVPPPTQFHHFDTRFRPPMAPSPGGIFPHNIPFMRGGPRPPPFNNNVTPPFNNNVTPPSLRPRYY